MIEQYARFVMWITGHDRETVIQMYNDWVKTPDKELEASRDSRQLFAVPSEELQQLVNEALTTDGAHHKQWYIEKIADKLGLLTIIEHHEGIAP